MASECEHIAPGRAALLFALGCGFSLARRRAASWFKEEEQMHDRGIVRLALVCGAAAMSAGLALMAVAGAPESYLAINPLTGLLALLAFPFLVRLLGLLARRPATTAAVLGALLLATIPLGTSIDGVTRWVKAGPIALQVSFLVLPVLVALVARLPGLRAAPAILLAAAGLALQPDRAMAAALLLAVGVIALLRRERSWAALLAPCAAASIFAFSRPDPMPELPFVDQLIPFAFSTHWALGLTVGVAMILPLLPFARTLRRTGAHGPAAAALGALWIGAVFAALLGNYPSPLVGYGASPILGYALSFAFLSAVARAEAARPGDTAREPASSDTGLRRQWLEFWSGPAPKPSGRTA